MKAKSAKLTIKHEFINKYTIKEKKGSGGTALAFLITEKETKKITSLNFYLLKKLIFLKEK